MISQKWIVAFAVLILLTFLEPVESRRFKRLQKRVGELENKIAAIVEPCRREEEVSAVSFISRNSKPPAGTETPVVGTVKLKQSGFGYPTFMDVQISGLPPNTTHGFHVHQYRNTVTDGCQSTGGHYNPFGKTHGAPTSPIRHVGDLGNLVSDDQGQVNVKIEDHLVSLVGPYSIIGRAFVVTQ